jgi:hypothetical protein
MGYSIGVSFLHEDSIIVKRKIPKYFFIFLFLQVYAKDIAKQTMTIFGQVVIGPPGSGKSTYCKAMREFLTGLGRKVAVVNLDPGNDILPYECEVDISTLVTLMDVMENLKLGPNGGLIYCMEYLETNSDWLIGKLENFKDCYILFDCPGQVELYTHHKSVRNIVHKLQENDFRVML